LSVDVEELVLVSGKVGTGIVSFDSFVYSGRVSYSGFSFGTIIFYYWINIETLFFIIFEICIIYIKQY